LVRGFHDSGQVDDARRIIDSIREYAPKYRPMNAARIFSYPVAAERKRMITALRAAGLPE